MPRYGRKGVTSKKKGYGGGGKAWYSRKYSPVDLAAKAWSGVKMLKALINVEKKFFDIQYTKTAMSTTPVVSLVTGVVEGTDYNNRVGLSIKGTSLLVKGNIDIEPAATTTTVVSGCARVIVFMDMDNNPSDAPAYTDVLEMSDINSPINHTNGKRFKIIRDKTFPLGIYSLANREFKMYCKIDDHIKYSNSTTGSRENQIYVLTYSSVTGSSTVPAMNISWYSRLRYVDN